MAVMKFMGFPPNLVKTDVHTVGPLTLLVRTYFLATRNALLHRTAYRTRRGGYYPPVGKIDEIIDSSIALLQRLGFLPLAFWIDASFRNAARELGPAVRCCERIKYPGSRPQIGVLQGFLDLVRLSLSKNRRPVLPPS